jgi:hypothetical protein
VAGIIGLLLVVYLTMVSGQTQSTMRSLSWNSAIPMAEAGIEEALAHLNYAGTTNLASANWTLISNRYTLDRTLGDGYTHITISTDAAPVLVSQGFVRAPLQSTYICRTVRAATKKRTCYQGPFTAKDKISMSGGTIDSFDSSDPLYNTLGRYDPFKQKANARVQCASTAAAAIAVGNADVYGSVATGPGGTVTVGSSGCVGDVLWDTNPLNAGTIQSGHRFSDVNLSLEDVGVPFTNGYATPASGTYPYNGTNYTYRLDTGTYQLSSLTVPGGDAMLVTGDATLYVVGNFTTSGSGYVYIAPGATLRLYVGGTATISGDGVVNGAGNAANFSIFGLPTCTKVVYSGSAQFIGTLYAPQADLTMSGSAAGVGAVISKTATLSGGMSFHYDEALGGGGGKYLVISWQEI